MHGLFSADIERMRKGRLEGKSPKIIEFYRLQELGAMKIKQELSSCRNTTMLISKHSSSIVLGIMAETGEKGLTVLQGWINNLNLKDVNKSSIRMVDVDGAAIDQDSLLNKPVYIKYNSTISEDTYMKQYGGENEGVIFQPLLSDQVFRQYGNFPLSLFR
eukprot:gene15143-20395_t